MKFGREASVVHLGHVKVVFSPYITWIQNEIRTCWTNLNKSIQYILICKINFILKFRTGLYNRILELLWYKNLLSTIGELTFNNRILRLYYICRSLALLVLFIWSIYCFLLFLVFFLLILFIHFRILTHLMYFWIIVVRWFSPIY